MELPLRRFDQESLEDSDQIALYSKLIDVIDRDIDNIRTGSAREGLTMWGILGAIVAGLGYLFGKTSQLDHLPALTPEVACSSLLFFYLIWLLYNVLSGAGSWPKPGRLISYHDFVKGRVFFLIVRFVILLALTSVILQMNLSLFARMATVILGLFPTLIGAGSVLAMKFTDRPYGNNPQYRISTIFFLSVSFLCYLVPIVVIGGQLKFPVGQELSDAFSIGMTISAIVVLFELFLILAADNSNVKAYTDLRDDLILRDIGLNDALSRLRIVKEGKSSWDELKGDFEKVKADINHMMTVFDEQLAIIKKQENADEAEFQSLSKSFMVHLATIKKSDGLLTEGVQEFGTRLQKTFAATGDRHTDNYIRSELDSALRELQEKQNAVAHANMDLFQRRTGKLKEHN
jgi:hypothetical protein